MEQSQKIKNTMIEYKGYPLGVVLMLSVVREFGDKFEDLSIEGREKITRIFCPTMMRVLENIKNFIVENDI